MLRPLASFRNSASVLWVMLVVAAFRHGRGDRVVACVADAFVPPFSQPGSRAGVVHRPTASRISSDPLQRWMAPRRQQQQEELQEESSGGDGTDLPARIAAAVFAGSSSADDGVPSAPLDRPVLSVIDLTGLFVFAGIGKASHSAVDGSLDVAAVLVTVFPFWVSWLLLAPLAGCYTPEATRDTRSAAVQAAKGWILAVPMGCVLRGIIRGYAPPIPFVVVTLLSTLVILTLGRVGYTVLSELYVEMF